MNFETFRMPDCNYQWCGKRFDCASSDEGPPAADDFTICIECLGWSVFTKDLTVRKPNEKETQEIAQSKECKRVLRAMLQAKTIYRAKQVDSKFNAATN